MNKIKPIDYFVAFYVTWAIFNIANHRYSWIPAYVLMISYYIYARFFFKRKEK